MALVRVLVYDVEMHTLKGRWVVSVREKKRKLVIDARGRNQRIHISDF